MHVYSKIVWIINGNLFTLALLLGWVQGFKLEVHGGPLAAAAATIAGGIALARYSRDRPELARIAVPFLCLAEFTACGTAALFLQYPAASLRFPCVDGALAAGDRWIGLEWPTQFAWASAHPPALAAADFVYRLLLPQIPVICIVVGYADPERLRAFTLANAIGVALTIALSAMLPAASAYNRAGLAHLADFALQFEAVRDGRLRALDPAAMAGLVSFPSFHTLLAVLVACSCARLPRLFPFVVLLEAAIVACTPLMGGHYIADVVAGGAIGIGVFCFAVRLGRRSGYRSTRVGAGVSVLSMR